MTETTTLAIATMVVGALGTAFGLWMSYKMAQLKQGQTDAAKAVEEVKLVADKTHDATNSHALVMSGQYAQLAKRMAVLSGRKEDAAIAESAQALYDSSFAANEAAKAQAVRLAAATPVKT